MSEQRERVPDWLLEKLAAGGLPARQSAELRATLHECGEDHRLASLAASNAEILAALPSAAVAAEVERRAAAHRGSPQRRRPPLFALSLAATCAAGLTVFLLVRGQPGQPPPTFGVTDPETITVKGSPSLRIHRKTKTGEERLQADAVVRKGDTLQLGYVAAGKRYGVIASVDARGAVTLHLPETPGAAAALEKGGEHALPHAFELDDSPGFERFVFVTSDKSFTTKDVIAAMTGGRALPGGLATVDVTLRKESP